MVSMGTVGNITGIYDMSGGASDAVMAVYNKTIGSSGINFSTIDAKYYDNYTNTTVTAACNGKICYGHGLSETSGWYSDSASTFVSSSNPWLFRGYGYGSRSEAGVFCFSNYSPYGQALRVVITEF